MILDDTPVLLANLTNQNFTGYNFANILKHVELKERKIIINDLHKEIKNLKGELE